MTDAKTQRLMDELVTLRRENLALRLSKAQLEDVLKQRELEPPLFIGSDGKPRRVERAPHLTRCLCAGVGDSEVTGAENRSASEGQPACAASEAWAQAVGVLDARSDYLIGGACRALAKAIGYADFDRSIAKAGSEEDGSV